QGLRSQRAGRGGLVGMRGDRRAERPPLLGLAIAGIIARETPAVRLFPRDERRGQGLTIVVETAPLLHRGAEIVLDGEVHAAERVAGGGILGGQGPALEII